MVVGPATATEWGTPEGIHSARVRGRTQVRSTPPITSTPRGGRGSWWRRWAWRTKRSAGASSNAIPAGRSSRRGGSARCPPGDIGRQATPFPAAVARPYGPVMTPEHLDLCASDEWRDALRDWILPYALADAKLGDDVVEIGPGPGRTTELL